MTDEEQTQLQTHLQNLSNQQLLPGNHINYLWSLKRSGFEPKVIYDIGSCVLHWTNIAKTIWPDATYILFDAFTSAEFLYKKGGYQYHIGVLSDVDNRVVKFYENKEFPGGNSYYRESFYGDRFFPADKYIEYTTRSLDSIVKERGFPPPEFIKIDTQGSEKDIITGATETLKSVKHMIIEMQHTNYNDNAPKVDETLPYIESFGFKCVAHRIHDNGPDADYGFARNPDT